MQLLMWTLVHAEWYCPQAALADKDVSLANGLARLEGGLAAVTDERDDLAQRIRFLERQLHRCGGGRMGGYRGYRGQRVPTGFGMTCIHMIW